MGDEVVVVVLDQNIPIFIQSWLRSVRPSWTVRHATELGMARASDRQIFDWANGNGAIVVTFDEDFADRRGFVSTGGVGVIPLRVWPTTEEAVRLALERLLGEVPARQLRDSLVIVGRNSIRVRPLDVGTG